MLRGPDGPWSPCWRPSWPVTGCEATTGGGGESGPEPHGATGSALRRRRRAHGQEPRAEDRLRARAVQQRLGRHRLQRLRHPRRHPQAGPGRGAVRRRRSARSPPGPSPPIRTAAATSRSCAAAARSTSTTSSRCPTPGRRAPSSGGAEQAHRVRQRPAPTCSPWAPRPTAARGTATRPPGCRRTKGYRCTYVAGQVAVKKKYVWVTGAERDAMKRVLGGCPDQKLPTGGNPTAAPPPVPCTMSA